MEATMEEPTTKQPSQASPLDSTAPTTGTTEWLTLWVPFAVDAEGCTVRLIMEQKYYHLASTRPNYNAMYSLLLACLMNGNKVQLEYTRPIPDPTVPTPELPTFNIVSIQAMPPDM
jgi:hypothetical protein